MGGQRWAPRASRQVRLAIAAVVWSAVGAGLLAAGLRWLLGSGSWAFLAAVPLALALGLAKGRFVLAPRATANAERIVAAGETRCIGGVFSWAAWILAIGMMVGGAALRRTAIPRPWLGLLYAAVGTALVAASVHAWTHWWRHRREHGAAGRP